MEQENKKVNVFMPKQSKPKKYRCQTKLKESNPKDNSAFCQGAKPIQAYA